MSKPPKKSRSSQQIKSPTATDLDPDATPEPDKQNAADDSEDFPDSVVNGISLRERYEAMERLINETKHLFPELPEEFVKYPSDYELEQDQRADEMDEKLAQQDVGELSDEAEEDDDED